MEGSIRFLVNLSVTMEDLQFLQDAVAHYRATHSAASGKQAMKISVTLMELASRVERTDKLVASTEESRRLSSSEDPPKYNAWEATRGIPSPATMLAEKEP
ncbi:MAG: hypothetical protein L0Y56_11815 [Nitrospira sp.]|nr:hypothetical protein [Nitrospira sp.]